MSPRLLFLLTTLLMGHSFASERDRIDARRAANRMRLR